MALDNNSVAFELWFKDNLTNSLNATIQKALGGLGKLEGAKASLGKTSGGLLGSLSGVGGGLTSMLLPLGGVTAGIGLLGAGLKSVISTGAGFTKVMSNVKALTNANTEEFKRLNDAAISLGASTSFSSSEVADAMVVAGQAGQGVNQIIQAMPGYLDLAASSQLGLAESVEIGLSTMQQFGLKAGDMSSIVDQLAFTSVKSSTGLNDIGEALKYIGPAAASMRVPLNETLASIGVLADNGLKGSLATRALSTSIQRLSAPTDKMAMVMKQLNVQFFDSEGKFIGINNSVALLEDRMKGFTDEQKASAISTLMGADAFGEWNILMKTGAEGLRTLTGEIKNSQGTAARIAKTQLDNLSGDVEQFGGAWESLQLKMFGQGEGLFRGFVQMGTTFLNRLSDAWTDLTKPIGEVWHLLGDVWNAIKELLVTVGLANSDFDLLGGFFKFLAWNINNLTLGIKAFLNVWLWLLNGIKTGIQYVQSFWDTLQNMAGNIMKVFTPVGTLLEGIFTLNWDKVKSGYSGIKNGISSLLGDAGKTFGDSLAARQAKGTAGQLVSLQPDAGLSPMLGKGSPLMAPNAVTAGKTKTEGGAIDVVGGKGEGKSVVVNINNLINSLSISGANLQQDLKQAVAEALTDAVRDFEQSYN
ncbi:MAG TPA: phage tail tape measure protein [Chryseolinea sp.]|nr:phage tail tape measure protein [Chryseolinea sp.]